ncbi:DNA primase [Pseudalkalibacillus caeni]|uniref:DNA primase n=1 Tax=Exobacillus caeni TaxID=2574798 RepID=A0A5R9FA17_9BACL|nr:DNA primase [Pseudalkalibacillus caeni]TLS39369.1 DNA primase [Pseudalkalibacillus caeni]
MAGKIPEETIEKIRGTADIVEVISDYVQLKKQGRNYFGLCPFHGEKTPSFSVAPDKQIFHCFGCGAGGNVFSFLMDMEGFSFIETIQHLSQKTGIELPETVGEHKGNQGSRDKEVMFKAHDFLAKLYHHSLINTRQGEKALEYLKQRGFTEEIIKTFQIGFAPDSWDFATGFLQKRNFPLDKAASAGLLSSRDFDGKYFDRFRNRVMFPIWDHKGQVIAFGGRILGEGEPKYLNSPETKIFHKGKFLYGFHMARSHIRKKQQLVLLEGYVDVTAAHGAGIQNAVASLGTALTRDQAELIRRHVESVVICYDSDKAGLNAAMKASEELGKAGCYVKIARMPDKMDPDDYIQKYGAERFKSDVIGSAQTVMAFKMDTLRKGKNLSDEGERIKYIEEVLREISSLEKAVERDHYLRQLADEFSLSLSALKQQQFQFYKQQKKRDNASKTRDNNSRKKIYTSKRLLPAFHNAEKILLAHMMRDLDIAQQVQEEIGGAFNIDEYSALAAYLYSYYAEGNQPDAGMFIEKLNDSTLVKAASEIAMMNVNQDISERELKDYIKQVLSYPKRLQIEEKEIEKKEAEQRQDFVLAAKIAMEILEMKKNLKSS